MDTGIRDLQREYWGRIHDMCEGTGLEDTPWRCVKHITIGNNFEMFNDHPKFNDLPTKYICAVEILEDNPVFVGDVVYSKLDNGTYTIVKVDDTYAAYDGDASTIEIDYWDEVLTWQPPEPKRTFEINGVELPCPVVNGKYQILFVEIEKGCNYFAESHKITFGFDSDEDKRKVLMAIKKTLNEARDK